MGLKIMEIFNSALKSWGVSEWFAGKGDNVYPLLLALVRKYPNNNIFHNEVFKFIRSSLISPADTLIEFVIFIGFR